MDPNYPWNVYGQANPQYQYPDNGQGQEAPLDQATQGVSEDRMPYASPFDPNTSAVAYPTSAPHLSQPTQGGYLYYGSSDPQEPFPSTSLGAQAPPPSGYDQGHNPGNLGASYNQTDPSFVPYTQPRDSSNRGDNIPQTSSYPSVKFVEGNKHPCPYDWCKATFTRPNDLQRHLNTATVHKAGGQAGGAWVCARCGEEFSRGDALKRHEAKSGCSKSK